MLFFRASREPGTSQNDFALFNHGATKRSWSDNIFSPLFGNPFFSKRVDQPQLTRRDQVVTWLVTWSQAHWQLCSQVVCKPLENAVPSAESCLHFDQGLTRTWTLNFTYQASRGSIYGVSQTGKLFSQAAFAREWVAQGLRPECVAEAEESTRSMARCVFLPRWIWDLGFRHIDFSTSYMQVNL